MVRMLTRSCDTDRNVLFSKSEVMMVKIPPRYLLVHEHLYCLRKQISYIIGAFNYTPGDASSPAPGTGSSPSSRE